MADSIKAIVFDAYGTLFDVHSVSNLCEDFSLIRGEILVKLGEISNLNMRI